MIDGVMNLSHWNICWKSNTGAPVAVAYAVETVTLEQILKVKHRLPPANQA
jgi:hypothetical protein